MAPKLDFAHSMANDFGSGSAFAIKTVKGNGLANRKNAPMSGRRDSGSPTNEAGQANHAGSSSSRLAPRALNESNVDVQTTNLTRMHSGTATLGVNESDEDIRSEGSEDDMNSRRSGRSNDSAGSRGSHSSNRSGESRGRGSPRSRRHETSGRRSARPAGPRSQPESTRLTKSALKSLRKDRGGRTLQEETFQRRTAKVRIATREHERKAKRSKEVKEEEEDEIRFEMDHKRGMLVRRGLYSDGTKPWQHRFGDPHADVLSKVGLRGVYEKVKKSFYWAF